MIKRYTALAVAMLVLTVSAPASGGIGLNTLGARLRERRLRVVSP
jgi:hypothetical protein